jgi:O-antigen ligase
VFAGFAIIGATAPESSKMGWRVAWLTTAIVAVIGVLSLVHSAVDLPFGADKLGSRSLGPLSFAVSRTLGIDMGYGAYGVLVAIGVATIIGTIWTRGALWPGRPHSLWAAGIATICIATGVYISQSRSLILNVTAVISTAALVWLFRTDRNRLRNAIVGIGVLVGLPIAGVVVPDLLHAFLSAGGGSVGSRVAQYRFAANMLATRPITGYGWGYFLYTFPAELQIHNLWLNIGGAVGLLGVLLSLAAFVYLWIGLFCQAIVTDGRRAIYGLVGLLALTGACVELSLFTGIADVTALVIFVGMSMLTSD